MHSANYLFVFLCMVSGCQTNDAKPKPLNSASKPEYKPVVIKNGMENGHPSGIRIAIQTTKDSDKSTTYKLLSSYQGSPVGFLIVIPRETDGKQQVSPSYIKSLGEPSNLFLHLLAEQYKQKLDSTTKMADSIPFICMNLYSVLGPPDKLKEGDWIAAQYKLFFDADTNGEDAELFMNIATGKWIEFAEKDDEYRAHLMHIFSRSNKLK
jgi:hypothetical protein